MKEDEKSVGEQFCDALYEALAFACRKVLEEDLQFPKTELYMYSEVFEHFEWVMLKLQPFQTLMNMYDDLSPQLVGFAITKDPDDFEVEWLSDEVLIDLKNKINTELQNRGNDSAKSTKMVCCDNCDNLRYNGVCNYCALTMQCYDGKEDLNDDGTLPKCPLKNKSGDKNEKV